MYNKYSKQFDGKSVTKSKCLTFIEEIKSWCLLEN